MSPVVTEMEPRPCLKCGALLNMATGFGHSSAPQDGDLTACLECGGVMQFSGNGFRLVDGFVRATMPPELLRKLTEMDLELKKVRNKRPDEVAISVNDLAMAATPLAEEIQRAIARYVRLKGSARAQVVFAALHLVRHFGVETSGINANEIIALELGIDRMFASGAARTFVKEPFVKEPKS